jgi:PAS domain S-box-containing protein
MTALPVRPAPAAWLLLAGVFLSSLVLPPAYQANSLYVLPLMAAVFAPDPALAYRLAAGATAAILTTLLMTPPAQPAAAVLVNRGAALVTVWLTAIVVVRYRRGVEANSATERALADSLRDLQDIRHALDQSAIVASTNVKGDIVFVNEKFCEISQYSRDELLGANHRILNSGLHSTEFFREMYRTIGSGRVWRGELRNRAKDGTHYWVDTTIVPFLDDKGHPWRYIAIRYDITERKMSEAKLRDQTSLVQLGKMAAIVAHEVRNPLAGIRGAVQVIGRRLTAGSPEQAIASEVIARIDALNDIVQDLLLFARPRQPATARLPLAKLVADVIASVKQDPQFAAIVFDVRAPELDIAADAEQLTQVLLNLVINAMEAIEGAGRVTVRPIAEARGTGRGVVGFEVRDTGIGIPPEELGRVTEPFFSTKNGGTGLGLAIVNRIVERHGGTMHLESRVGEGTAIRVWLPRTPSPAGAMVQAA